MRTTEWRRKKLKRGFATSVLLALLLPLWAGAGEKKWKEALLIEGPKRAKDNNLGEANKNQVERTGPFTPKSGLP